MTPKEIIISKFTSGKFWLTIICGMVFAYVSIKKIIPPDAVITIITMVFISYFTKPKQENGENK